MIVLMIILLSIALQYIYVVSRVVSNSKPLKYSVNYLTAGILVIFFVYISFKKVGLKAFRLFLRANAISQIIILANYKAAKTMATKDKQYGNMNKFDIEKKKFQEFDAGVTSSWAF